MVLTYEDMNWLRVDLANQDGFEDLRFFIEPSGPHMQINEEKGTIEGEGFIMNEIEEGIDYTIRGNVTVTNPWTVVKFLMHKATTKEEIDLIACNSRKFKSLDDDELLNLAEAMKEYKNC